MPATAPRIEAGAFLTAAAASGIRLTTGVPCSFLTPLINAAASSRTLRHVGAASEGEAVAIAAGAWLGGQDSMVMLQNSGLGNAVNPLTSLSTPFRIPALLIVTWRGQPGLADEPQHELMGRITQDLLTLMELPHRPFPSDLPALDAVLEEAREAMQRTGLPFALVVQKDSLGGEALNEPAQTSRPPGLHVDLREGGARPSRIELLERVLALAGALPVIATTGKTGRELFTLDDREQHLYQVGSMGCAAPMGLGVALATGCRPIVLDGDGAALMKLGSLATIGAWQPDLLHVVLDNGVHDSTGGQATVSVSVDFAGVALACGYAQAFSCDSAIGFDAAMREALAARGPILLHARIRPGSIEKLGRPALPPHEVARRFRAWLAQEPGR